MMSLNNIWKNNSLMIRLACIHRAHRWVLKSASSLNISLHIQINDRNNWKITFLARTENWPKMCYFWTKKKEKNLCEPSLLTIKMNIESEFVMNWSFNVWASESHTNLHGKSFKSAEVTLFMSDGFNFV
jgi:hypothetical protein